MSAVPAVKAALITLLRAQYSAASVQVFYGPPTGTPVTDDAVAVIGADPADQEAVPMGTRAREERFSMVVVCSSYRGGGDEVAQATTEAAYALLAVVEGVLRTDPSVSGTCRKAELGRHALTEEPTDVGRIAEIAAVVDVLARI